MIEPMGMRPEAASARDVPEGGGKAAMARWERLAAGAVGRVIEFWGFKHSHGRVWALLYLRGEPITAAAIQEELELSKGSVSMVTRELEQWGVIHRERDPEGGAWRFSAEQDLLRMVTGVLAQREARLVRGVREELAEAEKEAKSDRHVSRRAVARLRRMRKLAELVERSLTVFLKTAHLDATELREVLSRAPGRGRHRR